MFLLLAFGIAWVGEFVVWALGFSLANPLAQLPFAFAPAIAAIVVRRWVTREGFADSGLRPRFRKNAGLYLLAWLVPLALVVATAALAAALGLWRPSLAGLDQQAGGLPFWVMVAGLMVVTPLLTPIYWGEEYGWTAYLRDRIAPGRPLAATLATGVIWAVWHYPLAFLGYIEFGNPALGLAVWSVSFICQEVLLSWLWSRGGGIWPVALAHSGNNMVLALLTGLLLTEGGGLDVVTVTALTTAPMAALALWIVLTGRLRRGRVP